MPSIDGMAPAPVGSSISLVVALHGISEGEIRAFRHGLLRISIYVRDRIPFICAAFHDAKLEMNCYFNAWLIPPPLRDVFFAEFPEANLVSIFLVDRATGYLQGIRAVGLPVSMMSALKLATFDQYAAFADCRKVDQAAQKILNEVSLKKMLADGSSYDFAGDTNEAIRND
jgi:hypothetical protein